MFIFLENGQTPSHNTRFRHTAIYWPTKDRRAFASERPRQEAREEGALRSEWMENTSSPIKRHVLTFLLSLGQCTATLCPLYGEPLQSAVSLCALALAYSSEDLESLPSPSRHIQQLEERHTTSVSCVLSSIGAPGHMPGTLQGTTTRNNSNPAKDSHSPAMTEENAIQGGYPASNSRGAGSQMHLQHGSLRSEPSSSPARNKPMYLLSPYQPFTAHLHSP